MEKKKLTRDQALIKLLRESDEKDARIKELESDKKDFEKRLKKLEKTILSLTATLKETGRIARIAKQEVASQGHMVQSINETLQRAKR